MTDLLESAVEMEALGVKKREAQRVAAEMYRQRPDWVTFFREILGVDGVLQHLFPTPEEMAAFEKTSEYVRIQRMLGQLREESKTYDEEEEPTRVITVRLPRSVHESLKEEAFHRRTSMNRLCITKLIQPISEEAAAALSRRTDAARQTKQKKGKSSRASGGDGQPEGRRATRRQKA